jgi:DNA-directed RNA polymerase subunit RPC12/RpoP
MELIKRKKQAIVAACETCGRQTEVPLTNTIAPHRPSIELKEAIKCECGEYHNLIVTPSGSQPMTHKPAAYREDTQVKCPRCGSNQLHADKKGFGLGKAAAGGALFGTVGLLGGLVGKNKVTVTCLKCGHKWPAGKN